MDHPHHRRGCLLLPIYVIVIKLVCLTAARGLIIPSDADSMLIAPDINPRDAHHDDNHSHFTFDCTYYHHRRHLVPSTKHSVRIDTGGQRAGNEPIRILRISSGDGIFLRCSMVIDHVDQCPTFLDHHHRNSSNVGIIDDEPKMVLVSPDHCRDLRIVLEFPESISRNQSRESNPMIEESVVGKKQKQKAINSTLADAEAMEIDPDSELYEAWINITNFTQAHQGVYRFSFYTLRPPSTPSSNENKNHQINGTQQQDSMMNPMNPFGTKQQQQLIYEYRFMLMMMNVASDETIISPKGGGGGGNDPTTMKNSLSLWNTTRIDHSIKSRRGFGMRIRSIILYKWWWPSLVIVMGLFFWALIIKRTSCTKCGVSSLTIHHIV